MAASAAADAEEIGDGVDGSLEASVTASAAATAAAGAENAAMGRPPREASDSFEPMEELFEPEAVQPDVQGPFQLFLPGKSASSLDLIQTRS